MLMKLLKIIYEKGLYSKQSIAKEMNLSIGVLEDMINQLIRMGYIEEVKNSDCSCNCKTCSGCCNGSNANLSFIKITEKGFKRI